MYENGKIGWMIFAQQRHWWMGLAQRPTFEENGFGRRNALLRILFRFSFEFISFFFHFSLLGIFHLFNNNDMSSFHSVYNRAQRVPIYTLYSIHTTYV